MMLEATRKALAKAQTAAKSDITAAAGTLAGEQQRRLAAEAGAAEAREQARAASAALAAEQGSRNSQLERFQERVEAAEAQLSTARVRPLPAARSLGAEDALCHLARVAPSYKTLVPVAARRSLHGRDLNGVLAPHGDAFAVVHAAALTYDAVLHLLPLLNWSQLNSEPWSRPGCDSPQTSFMGISASARGQAHTCPLLYLFNATWDVAVRTGCFAAVAVRTPTPSALPDSTRRQRGCADEAGHAESRVLHAGGDQGQGPREPAPVREPGGEAVGGPRRGRHRHL